MEWIIKLINLVNLFLFLGSVSKSQHFDPPPVVWIDRQWTIPEDEPVGTRVAHAKPQEPGAKLEYSLEPSAYLDGSSFFQIDPKSGAVTLKESMIGKKGKQYYLKVVAARGTISSSTEVWVQITGGAGQAEDHSISNIPPGFPYQNPKNPLVNQRPPGSRPVFPPALQSSLSPKLLTTVPSSKLTTVAPSTENTTTGGLPAITPQNSTMTISQKENTNLKHNISTVVTTTISPTTTQEQIENNNLPSKPIYPPHLTNSNKNNFYETGRPDAKNDVVEMMSSNELLTATPPAIINNIRNNSLENEDDSGSNIVALTIVPIVLLFGVVPIIVASVWLIRKRTKVKKRPTKEMRKESAATTNSSMTMSAEGNSASALKHWIKQAQSNRYESWNPDADPNAIIDRWEFPRHHLQIGGILGEGCFGQVWRCEALNIDGKEGTTTVAVKTLKESAGERERADLLSELAVMKMLDPHPHVVRLLGSCTEKDPIFLIMEFVALGKLQSYLRSSRATHYYGNLHADSGSISSKDLTAFCYQTAKGMEYLASKGIIHRDLAARNILIDKDRVCKVADFGFARDVIANHVYERKTDGRLPVRWMAPEALYDNIFTTKTDIWSFGVLMWEIVTLGSTPYPGIGASDVMKKVRDGYRLEKPEHCRRELYNIMFYCWAQNPDDRPTFSDLVNFLKQLLFSETDYIELDRFPDHNYYNMSSLSGEKL